MLGLAALLLVLTVVVEVALFIVVANWINLAWALALVLATSVLGAWLLRREGVRGWRRFRTAVAEGRPPGREATDGVVGMLGAVLLLVPGFLTDVIGLLLLLPPARALARSGVRRSAERRVSPAVAGDLFGPRRVRRVTHRPPPTATSPPSPSSPSSLSSPTGGPVEGEVVEGEIVDPDHRRRGPS